MTFFMLDRCHPEVINRAADARNVFSILTYYEIHATFLIPKAIDEDRLEPSTREFIVILNILV